MTPWTVAQQASLSSTSPGVHSNSYPLSQWCNPTIWSSVIPFSSCLQPFPASVFFVFFFFPLRSQLFTSGGQSTGGLAKAKALVFLVNIQSWFPSELTKVWSSCSPRTLKSLLQYHSSKSSVLQCSGFFMVQLSHLYMTTEKTVALTIRAFVSKVMFLIF